MMALAALAVVVLIGGWFLLSNRGAPARPVLAQQVEHEKL